MLLVIPWMTLTSSGADTSKIFNLQHPPGTTTITIIVLFNVKSSNDEDTGAQPSFPWTPWCKPAVRLASSTTWFLFPLMTAEQPDSISKRVYLLSDHFPALKEIKHWSRTGSQAGPRITSYVNYDTTNEDEFLLAPALPHPAWTAAPLASARVPGRGGDAYVCAAPAAGRVPLAPVSALLLPGRAPRSLIRFLLNVG